MALRFDRSTSNKITRTKEGFLKAEAHVAKVGILKYRLFDGTTRSEFVPPETLFDAESIDTLKLSPVVMEHAGGKKIDVKNVKQHLVGMTGDNVKMVDNLYLDSSLVITDEKSIQAIQNGSNEISCCYDSESINEPGEYNGEPYTHVQKKRTYNHVSFTRRGRAGSDVALRFDSLTNDDGFEVEENFDGGPGSGRKPEGISKEDHEYAIRHSREIANSGKTLVTKHRDKVNIREGGEYEENHLAPGEKILGRYENGEVVDRFSTHGYGMMDSDNTFSEEKRMKILINGIEYDAAPEVINALKAAETKCDSLSSDLVAVKKESETVKGERDSLKTKFDSLSADIPAKIASGVKERSDLVATASKILKDAKFDSMSNEDIRKAVITARLPKISLEGKTGEYVQACFDSAIENCHEEASASQRFQSATYMNMDSAAFDGVDADESRKKMIERQVNGK